MYRKITLLLLSLVTPLHAEERHVTYTEDPVVEKGLKFHTIVVDHDIGMDAGECVIYNSFAEGEPEEFIDGFGKIHVINSKEATVGWFTLKEMASYAANICWSTSPPTS